MQRKAKTVTTKDGYTIKKHSITLFKDRFYSIEKNGESKGWFSYGELYNALKVCRLMKYNSFDRFGVNVYEENTLIRRKNF